MNAPAPVILPDLDGKVHGIKSLHPLVIQCDGCGAKHEGTSGRIASEIIMCPIKFHGARHGDRRRMCPACWTAEGVEVPR